MSFLSSPPGTQLKRCGHWCKCVQLSVWLWGPTPGCSPPLSSLRETLVQRLPPADGCGPWVQRAGAQCPLSSPPALGTTGQASVCPFSRFSGIQSLTGFLIPVTAPMSPSGLSPREEPRWRCLLSPKVSRAGASAGGSEKRCAGEQGGRFTHQLRKQLEKGPRPLFPWLPACPPLSGAVSGARSFQTLPSATCFSAAFPGCCLRGQTLLNTLQK